MEVTRKYKVEKVEVVTIVDKTAPDGVTITLSEKDASSLYAFMAKSSGTHFDNLFMRLYESLKKSGVTYSEEQGRVAFKMLQRD